MMYWVSTYSYIPLDGGLIYYIYTFLEVIMINII